MEKLLEKRVLAMFASGVDREHIRKVLFVSLTEIDIILRENILKGNRTQYSVQYEPKEEVNNIDFVLLTESEDVIKAYNNMLNNKDTDNYINSII